MQHTVPQTSCGSQQAPPKQVAPKSQAGSQAAVPVVAALIESEPSPLLLVVGIDVGDVVGVSPVGSAGAVEEDPPVADALVVSLPPQLQSAIAERVRIDPEVTTERIAGDYRRFLLSGLARCSRV